MAKLKAYRTKRNFGKTQGTVRRRNRSAPAIVCRSQAPRDGRPLRSPAARSGRAEKLGGAEGAVAQSGRQAARGEAEDHPSSISISRCHPGRRVWRRPDDRLGHGQHGRRWTTPDARPEMGSFKFRLAGEKLNGGWMLARLKRKPEDKGRKNWLLFKERDPSADEKTDILSKLPESVKSGRRIEELVEKAKPPAKPARLKPGAVQGAKTGRCAKPRRAATRHAGGRPARRQTHERGVAARDQVRRLPHHGACGGRRGAADYARRARLDETLRRSSARFRQAAVQPGNHRRRGCNA